jgi:hypothetical protein
MALTIFLPRISCTVPGAVATPASCGEGISMGAGAGTVALSPGLIKRQPEEDFSRDKRGSSCYFFSTHGRTLNKGRRKVKNDRTRSRPQSYL